MLDLTQFIMINLMFSSLTCQLILQGLSTNTCSDGYYVEIYQTINLYRFDNYLSPVCDFHTPESTVLMGPLSYHKFHDILTTFIQY